MISNITIPSRLRKLLGRSPGLEAAVQSSLVEFGEWLSFSHVPFFPDYTDHGPSHISAVLATADNLIPGRVIRLLTPQDVAVLVLAALLHDVGMHLTTEGFSSLIQGQAELKPVLELNDEPWAHLWQTFEAEASRFTGRQNTQLFGHPEPIRAPSSDASAWTDSQYRLVGEFIRRHHTRLAHQIALYGVPGPSGSAPLRIAGPIGHLTDLAGLVARSHGMDLRLCLAYLDLRYNDHIHPLHTHALYLMALLRIADYLQIDRNRAPATLLRVKSLRSPVSVREWNKHLAVVDLNDDPNDPEALSAFITPPDVETFLGLRALFADIQTELDHTWAVLGETYGMHNRLKILALTVRRIKSNLEAAPFLSSLPFAPAHVRFEAAGADLLKLLVGPLYGDDPSFGVRELLQNAVDAVRELDSYCRRHQQSRSNLPLIEQEADVILSIDAQTDGSRTLTISDRGIGMTLDTIRNYFLRAGASFRNSSAWRQEFTDNEGRPQVLRSGRFGVGALAVFLLGDGITVTTRHVTSAGDGGLRFQASIDTDPIEVLRVPAKIGTSITVPLRTTALTQAGGTGSCIPSWYFLDSPTVLKKMNGRATHEFPGVVGPGLDSKLPTTWQSLPGITDPIVHWRRDCREKQPRILCNGILIQSGGLPYLWGDHALTIHCPTLSIFDFVGNLPLNLARTKLLLAELPFSASLIEDIARDYIAFMLVSVPPLKTIIDHRELRGYPHLSAKFGEAVVMPWVITRRGIVPLDGSALAPFGMERLLFLQIDDDRWNMTPDWPLGWAYAVLQRTLRMSDGVVFTKDLTNLVKAIGSDLASAAFGLNISGFRILGEGSRDVIEIIKQRLEVRREPHRNEEDEYDEYSNPTFLLWSVGNVDLFQVGTCKGSSEHLRSLAVQYLLTISKGRARDNRPHPLVACEVHLAATKKKNTRSPVVAAWQKYCGSEMIPLNIDERETRLSGAFKALDVYVRAWKDLISQLPRRDDERSHQR